MDPSQLIDQDFANTTGVDIENPDSDIGIREMHPLSEAELKSLLSREIEDSLGGLTSVVAEQRRQAIRYYYGRQFGNEIDGRSKVVLTDVADTIDWIMPSLMRMFTGGRVVARYKPRNPEDEAMAKQATDYINMIFKDRMNGYQILYDWFKTGLLEKNGIVKVWCDYRTEPENYTYRGIDRAGLDSLTNSADVEVLEFDEFEADIEGEGTTLYNVKVRRTSQKVEIKVDGVPPEEFLIARRTIKLDDYVPFAAHRVKRTISDLIAMGVPKEVAIKLPSDDTPEYTLERTERLSEDETFPVTTAERSDSVSRDTWVTECYARIDFDGDGFAELRKVIVVGEDAIHVIANEEINWQPFCVVCPNPMPYKFFGLSVADQVSDLQLIRSTLLRQMLDNLYIQNNQRYEVVEGAVELDDLLTSVPGGLVRVTQQGSVTPLPNVPFGPMPMHMMEFLDGVRETRTGVSKWQQGPDASSLSNQTRGAVSDVMQASYAKIEQIARQYAETGVKDLFKKLLKLMIEENIKPDLMKLDGAWAEVNPQTWDVDMDVEIEVGLGVGQNESRIQHLMGIASFQEKALQGGLGGLMVTPKNLFNTTDLLAEAMGFKVEDAFFQDPGDQPFPPPPPDDKILEHERRKKNDMVQGVLETKKLQVDAANMSDMDKFRNEELRINTEIKREELEMRERVEMARIRAQVEIAAANKQETSNGDRDTD